MLEAEGSTKGTLDRTIKPHDMHCPEMSFGRSTQLNYWKRMCIKRQQDGICKRCKAGQAFLPVEPVPVPEHKPKQKPAVKPKPKRTYQQGRTCGVDGCELPHRAKGLCRKHYSAQAKRKKRQLQKMQPHPVKRCSVPGCDGRHLAKDLCRRHYERERNRRNKAAEADRRRLKTAMDAADRPVTYRLTFSPQDRDILQVVIDEALRTGVGFHQTMMNILRRGARK